MRYLINYSWNHNRFPGDSPKIIRFFATIILWICVIDIAAKDNNGPERQLFERISTLQKRIESIRIEPSAPEWAWYPRILLEKNGASSADLFQPLFGSKEASSSCFNIRRHKPWPAISMLEAKEADYQNESLYHFALAEIPLTQDLYISGRHYTVEELLENSMLECRWKPKAEIGRTLYAYLYYFSPNALSWENKYRERYNLCHLVEDVIQKDISQNSVYEFQALSLILSSEKWLHCSHMARQVEKIKRKMDVYLTILQDEQNQAGDFSCALKDDYYAQELQHVIARKMFYTSHHIKVLLSIEKDMASKDWVVSSIRFLVKGIDAYIANEINGFYKPHDLIEYYSVCYATRMVTEWERIAERRTNQCNNAGEYLN